MSREGKANGKLKIANCKWQIENYRLKSICMVVAALLTLLSLSACEKKRTEYFFESSGVIISVGGDCDKAAEALGKPNKSSSAPSCAGEGSDELYVYNGFKIYSHRSDKLNVITSIELTNDTVSTAEGVFIGDSVNRLSAVYGEGESFSGGVEYKSENCRLRFYIREDKVVGIRYD